MGGVGEYFGGWGNIWIFWVFGGGWYVVLGKDDGWGVWRGWGGWGGWAEKIGVSWWVIWVFSAGLIRKSPSWEPAIQDEKPVNLNPKQPLTIRF